MLSRCALLLVAGLLLTGAPGSAQNASRQSEAEIHVFLDQFIAAFDNLDWEKFCRCFADDAIVIHPALSSHRLDGRRHCEPAWG
jgi:ketosteroid isomerase-like protein